MINYRFLSSADSTSVFECFLAAFSDYEVEMRASREEFEQRLVRDGVQLEISAGAFDNGRMVGFYMNALGEWQGKQTAYDAGTGVIPDYRRQGIAEELFKFMVPHLKEASAKTFWDGHPACQNSIDDVEGFKMVLEQYEMVKKL